MKNSFILAILIVSLVPFSAQAKKKKNQTHSERTTDARFNGVTVHGKYAHSPETVVSVENDKKLISIVKPRKKFKYQIKKSLEDYK